MKDITHIRHDFQAVAWVMPQGWDLGVQGGQKLNLLNMVVWHIKLKGMISRPGYPKKVVGSKGQIPLDFFKSKPPIDFILEIVPYLGQQSLVRSPASPVYLMMRLYCAAVAPSQYDLSGVVGN